MVTRLNTGVSWPAALSAVLAGGSFSLCALLQAPAGAEESAHAVAENHALLSPQPVNVDLAPPTWPLPVPAAELLLPEVEMPVHLVIRLSDRRLLVYRDDTLEASFPIAIGREGWETPTGHFEVFQMLKNPGWTNPFTDEVVPPGPENPLGDRWIAFWTDGRNQIGFHGTPHRDSVGRAASHGCIRLYNEDVQALYSLVRIGTRVTVEP